jgi:hypothetical protein
MLIDVNDMESAVDGVFFHGQGEWYSFGEAQIDQLVEYMQEFHNYRKCVVNKEGIHTARQFTWAKSAEDIVELVKEEG